MDLQALFFTYLKVEKGFSQATLTAYKGDISAFADFLEQENGLKLWEKDSVGAIGHRSLRNWTGSLLKAKISTRTISRKISALNSYFTFLAKRGIITANPIQKIYLPKPAKKLAVFLKESETAVLFETLTYADTFEGRRDKCILEILYGCGIRRGELLSLKWKEIDFGNQTLTIMGKGNKPRIVPFGRHVLKSMEQYKVKCLEKNLNLLGVFLVKEDGKPMYDKLVYRITKKHFMQVSALSKNGPHVLRHTYATHLLNEGADLNDIKTLLGHSSLAATQIYTHNSLSKLKNAHNLSHPRAKNQDSTTE